MGNKNLNSHSGQGDRTSGHLSVLLPEVLGMLPLRDGKQFLDGTFGGGGHSRAILEAAPQAGLTAFDRDPAAACRAEVFAREFAGRFTFVPRNFSELGSLPEFEGTFFDGILFDLGVSSFQFDEVERGFSFRNDAPADMRMDTRSGLPAGEWLESADEADLVRAIRDFGEERNWRRVVRAIVAARGSGSLSRTKSLADLVAGAIPAKERFASKIHPATRAFQGIRIAVNDELGSIERALPAAWERLARGGVLAVISFHSLEDRIVKNFFRRLCGMPEGAGDHRPQDMRVRLAESLTRRPVVPGEAELAANPRSRSAKLRGIRKL